MLRFAPRLSHARRALSTAFAEEQGGKHVPFGEAGTGAYTALTKGCFDVIGRCEALSTVAIDHALAARKAQGTVGSTFTIADFGTADGGTSLPLLRTLVAQVRAAEPGAPIVVACARVHVRTTVEGLAHVRGGRHSTSRGSHAFADEDQAQNDWASVFHLTQGSLPNGPPTYLDGSVDNVYVIASGTSFYNQCLPPASVDFAFSATAMHWLTQLPCQIPDALHSACSTDSVRRPCGSSPHRQEAAPQLLTRSAPRSRHRRRSRRSASRRPRTGRRSCCAGRQSSSRAGRRAAPRCPCPPPPSAPPPPAPAPAPLAPPPMWQMVIANFAKDADGCFLGHTPCVGRWRSNRRRRASLSGPSRCLLTCSARGRPPHPPAQAPRQAVDAPHLLRALAAGASSRNLAPSHPIAPDLTRAPRSSGSRRGGPGSAPLGASLPPARQ